MEAAAAPALLRRLRGGLRFGAQQPVDLEPEQSGRRIEIEAGPGPAGVAVFPGKPSIVRPLRDRPGLPGGTFLKGKRRP